MANNPLITFKAGSCEIDQSIKPYKVVPNPTPGYVYLYTEENLIHFCWRERSKRINDEDNLDLVMLPADCRFLPYKSSTSEPNTKTNGRIFILKFSSSFQRYAFWMQSKPEKLTDPSHFSERDLKIGRVVDKLLQGEEVNVPAEIIAIKTSSGSGQNDEDEPMEDVEGHGQFPGHHDAGNGGAGPGTTDKDFRQEGANSREGGADGGRAAGYGSIDTTSMVRNFLDSLKGEQIMQGRIAKSHVLHSLNSLLLSSVTIPMIDSFNADQIDKLLSHLSLEILLIGQGRNDYPKTSTTDNDELCEEKSAAAIESLSFESKKSILKRVLRSPQLNQSLMGLTIAIQKGGLPNVAEALKIKVPNEGFMKGGTVPLAGSDAIEAFMAGIRIMVERSR